MSWPSTHSPESFRLACRDVVSPLPRLPTPVIVEEPDRGEAAATAFAAAEASIEVARRNGTASAKLGQKQANAANETASGYRNRLPDDIVSGSTQRQYIMVTVKPLRIFMDVLLLFLVWLPTILFAGVGHPFERGFYCDDESIRYPYKDSSVPNWVLYVVGAVLPIISIVTIETFRVLKFEPSFYNKPPDSQHELRGKPVPPLYSNLYTYIGYFAFGAALCQGLTDLGKYTVGRLRPHFYDVCKPDVDCSKLPAYHYVVLPNCTTQDHETLREARLSFPSGHSSFGAYTMFFLVMYIHARLIWPMVSLLVKHVLQNFCVVLGVACALSRISDYKHHWSDVLSGVILGVVVACLTTFHMLGLFRQPHFIFSQPSYLALPSTEFSFGGDHFHNSAEVKYVEQRFQEQNVTLKDLQLQQPYQAQVTRGVLQHRNAENGV